MYRAESESNFHATLSHSKQLLKYSPSDVSTILFTDEKIFTATTQKNPQNDRLYAYPSTRKKDVVIKRLRTQ